MLKFVITCAFLTWFILGTFAGVLPADNAVIEWDKAALQSIRETRPAPTVAARALAITHTCIFDAWAAYDQTAVATVDGAKLRRPEGERTEENKKKAVSFAAYRCLTDLFPTQTAEYDALMARLGYEANDSSVNPATPQGIGNLVASSILALRHEDGSNQLGDLHPGAYSDYTGYKPVNDPDHLQDPDRWQPLRVPDGHGGWKIQQFTTPQWGKIIPFALASGSEFRPDPPASYHADHRRYEKQAQELLKISANLTDEQRAIGEFWADGPSGELPPGIWCLFGQFISQRDHHSLDDDAKMFFALTNALLDASIAAWDAKRAYDSVRPVTAIHYLYSTKTVQGWAGLGLGIRPMDGSKWRPYQAVTVVTPPFPEFISGHSTFSAAAAEVLRAFTGGDVFGYSTVVEPGSSRIEPGSFPTKSITLSWATFSEAAEQAGLSRRYCGIHFRDGDLMGQQVGREVAAKVWKRAQQYIHGNTERGSLALNRKHFDSGPIDGRRGGLKCIAHSAN